MEETDMTQTPPENEMVSRVLSTTRKHRGLQGVTTGAKPGPTLTTMTTNPTFQWLHSPSVGVRGKSQGTQVDGGSTLGGDTQAAFVGREDGMTQGRVLGPGLQVAHVPLASASHVAPPTCRGGWNCSLAGAQQRGHDMVGRWPVGGSRVQLP